MVPFARELAALKQLSLLGSHLYKKQRLRINAAQASTSTKANFCLFDANDAQFACGTVFKVKPNKTLMVADENEFKLQLNIPPS